MMLQVWSSLDSRGENNDHLNMTKEEKRELFWKEIEEAEKHLLGMYDPVHYSIKWGIPLSKKYVKDLQTRKKDAAKETTGKK
jgi:hypothetical protein